MTRKDITYAEIVHASSAKLIEFDVLDLMFHPILEFVVVHFTVLFMAEIFAFGRHCNLRQCLRLSVRRGDDWSECDSSSSQFFRRKGLVVVVHDVNVSLEWHPWFEYHRFGARKFEFELGPDDARLDETVARFPHEVTVQHRRHSDNPTD